MLILIAFEVSNGLRCKEKEGLCQIEVQVKKKVVKNLAMTKKVVLLRQI